MLDNPVSQYQNSQRHQPNTPPSLSSNSSHALQTFPAGPHVIALGSNTRENLGDTAERNINNQRLVIEPILVLNLVRARSSWLALGTEPPADRSPNRRRIVWMCRSMHTWPIKLRREALGREIADWQTDRRRRRSAARRRTPSNGLLMVMLIEIASVLCHSVSQEAVDTR